MKEKRNTIQKKRIATLLFFLSLITFSYLQYVLHIVDSNRNLFTILLFSSMLVLFISFWISFIEKNDKGGIKVNSLFSYNYDNINSDKISRYAYYIVYLITFSILSHNALTTQSYLLMAYFLIYGIGGAFLPYSIRLWKHV